MGLDINVKTPIKFIGTERPDDEEIDYFCLYTLGFEPIMHLQAYKKGYWEYECSGDAEYSSPYGTFNDLREVITAAVYGCDYKEYVRQLETGARAFEGPFVEMLWFADNEGNFDYIIADKLLKDFQNWENEIVPKMNRDFLKKCHTDYMNVLKECIDCKGVVDYH